MKYIYKTKLLKQTQNKDPVIESMIAEGWSLHKNYKEGLVFKKSVPENWIRAWFVMDWEIRDGESHEIRKGPYASEMEAQDIIKISNNKNLRVERTWVAPMEAEPTGSRMDRLANIFCTSPTDKITIEENIEPKVEPTVVTTVVSDDQGDWRIRTTVDLINDPINTIGVRLNSMPRPSAPTTVSTDDIPRIRNYIARATSRRTPGPSVLGRARRSAPPPIRLNILDSMRNFGRIEEANKLESMQTDEPSENDLREMERALQAAQRDE